MSKYNDSEIIKIIRSITLDMIEQSQESNIGNCMTSAPILYTLYTNHLKFYPGFPTWSNRDRFIISPSHLSPLMYVILFISGYDYSMDDLKEYQKIFSITKGSLEYNPNMGIEATTGLPGQGISTGVGIAIANKYLQSTFSSPKDKLFDNKIYVLCNSSDLMEGISYEAMSLASQLNLDNLIVLYDANHVSHDGPIEKTFNENVLERFDSAGWHAILVKDGENIKDLNVAINHAKKQTKKPTIIQINSSIYKKISFDKQILEYSKHLNHIDLMSLKERLKLNNNPFEFDESIIKEYQEKINNKGKIAYENWKKDYDQYNLKNNSKHELNSIINKESIRIKLEKLINIDEINKNLSLRDINSIIMDTIANYLKEFIGCSTDKVIFTKAYLNKQGNFTTNNYLGRNILYGSRENLMASSMNGLALANMRPFCSTLLSHYDYLSSSLRMSAIMNLPVTYIFTHDTIKSSLEGPVFQSTDQLNSLRNIPNLTIYRPADIYELVGCWNNILESSKPSVLIIAKNKCEILNNSSIEKIKNGAYIISEYQNILSGIVLASGSEVSLAISIKNKLQTIGYSLRVISVPSTSLFHLADLEYQQHLLPKGIKIFAIEYGNGSIWQRYTKQEYIFSINSFGISGSKEEVVAYFELDIDSISEKIKKHLI